MTFRNPTNQASPNPPEPQTLDAAAMLDLWDGLQHVPAPLRLQRVARPWLDAGAGSVGAVQAAALQGYRACFEDQIRCHERCEICDTALGLDLSASELLAAHASAPMATRVLEHSGTCITYRLPEPDDLRQAATAADPRAALLAACVLSVEGPDPDLSDALIDQLAARMEEEDPLAAAEMALECPECGARWLSGFDACSAFLARLDAWARRTLWEVHQLAMRYGWSQRELLAMSPARREAYLMMDAP